MADEIREDKKFAVVHDRFVRGWGDLDPHAALDWTMKLSLNFQRTRVPTLIRRIADTDLLGALDRLVVMPGAAADLRLIQDLIPRIRADEFDGAVQKLSAISDARTRWFAMKKLAELLREETTSKKAKVVAEALQNDMPLLRYFEAAVLPPEPVTSDSLRGMRPSGSNNNTLRQWMDTLVEEERFDEGAEWIKTLPAASANVTGIGRFASAWAQESPGDVAKWALSLDVEGYRTSAINNLIQVWGKSDPATAVTFVDDLADDAIGRRLKAGFAGAWAGQQPIEALRWAVALPFGDEDQRAVEYAANSASTAPSQVVNEFDLMFP